MTEINGIGNFGGQVNMGHCVTGPGATLTVNNGRPDPVPEPDPEADPEAEAG